MAALSTAMALVMIAQGIAGLQWSPTSLQNNTVVYACATRTLSLPWSVTVAPGDTIVDISWFVSGTSQEMIAAVNHGNFFAMPAFANRARQLANAGVELDHVGVSETGNYIVEVVGRSAAGKFINLKRSVDVIVADGLQTTDGQLHVNQQQKAEYDVATDTVYVVLRCGAFVYPTDPAFGVTWETPSGERKSSRYNNGTFYLRLDTPVQGGVYTCRLPPASSCSNGNGSAVSVSVDKTEARLLLMEARQAALDARNKELETKARALELANNAWQAALQGLGEENHLLKDQQGSLQNRTAVLENNNSALENRVRVLSEENRLFKDQQGSLQNRTAVLENNNSALENRVRVLSEENHLFKDQQGSLQNRTAVLENNNSALENRVRVLSEDNQLLKVQQGSLQNRTAVLENQQNATEELLTQTVSFHASLSRYVSVDVARGALALPTVLRNHGNGYDNTTGIFTAPYSGTYCFLATAANFDGADDSEVILHIYVNGVDVAHTVTKPGLSYQPASLHAVVALNAGERVYLFNDYHVHYYGYVTTFSGFLVDHTPN